MTSTTPQNAPFGSILADVMAITWYRKGQWEPAELKAVGPIEIHPAAHVLHYGSECFEGFKAYAGPTAACTCSGWTGTSSA